MFEKLLEKLLEKLSGPALQAANSLRVQTRRSKVWRLSAFAILAVIAYLAMYVTTFVMVHKAFEETNVFTKASADATAVNMLKADIDSVTSCIESTEHDESLKDWYCAQARGRYLNQTAVTPKDFKDEIVSKLAYRTIRNELNKELRYLETEKALESTPQAYTQALHLVSNTYIRWLSLIMIAQIMLLAYFLLKTAPASKAGAAKKRVQDSE